MSVTRDAFDGLGIRPLGEMSADTFALTGSDGLSLINALASLLLPTASC